MTECSGQSDREILRKRDSLLTKYSFVRTGYTILDAELLLGNGTMGGLVLRSGLGFDSIWVSDLWEDKHNRIPLQGLKLISDEMNLTKEHIVEYSQCVALQDGVAHTFIKLTNGLYYETSIFFSAYNKHLLVMKLKDKSSSGTHKWTLRVPYDDYDYMNAWPEYRLAKTNKKLFSIVKPFENAVKGQSSDTVFTPCLWWVHCSKKLSPGISPNTFLFDTAPGEDVTITFSFATRWESQDYQLIAKESKDRSDDFMQLLKSHQLQWKKDWERTPMLFIPDFRHEQLFYRSVYWLFVQAGCERFLPGESQFAQSCWNMRPFTYGAAGWSVLAFEALGHPEKALNMLKIFYKPEALKKNATLYIRDTAKQKDAFSFAHEISTDGTTAITFDEQRHLNAFALYLFHHYYQLYPDDTFLKNYLYPVAKGVAEFWQGIAVWDDSLNAFKFPRLRSVSEDLFQESLMDIVLPAVWSLDLATMYAQKCNVDSNLQKQWQYLKNKIYVPQNKDIYLEYLGDDGNRLGGGYNGIRAPFYLGYPTVELIQQLDRNKALRTLDKTWDRNRKGEDMLGFIASWFALTEAHYERGDRVLEITERVFNCLDESSTALTEGPKNKDRFYFLTTSSSYLQIPLCMMFQMQNDEAKLFSSMPTAWKDAAFFNLTVNGYKKKSAFLKNGQIIEIKK